MILAQRGTSAVRRLPGVVRISLITELPDDEIARYYESAAIQGVEGGKLAGRAYVKPGGSWRAGYKDVVVEFFDGPTTPVGIRGVTDGCTVIGRSGNLASARTNENALREFLSEGVSSW
ncbi:hypothetical protein ABT294_38015 [Nonomuraea sp. NPDC000554]|uniref:hypothetical protein n=1 Tax=Nonomuraea sp. NPDC000554 TaxID=3154259 RepID=UPI00332E0AAD